MILKKGMAFAAFAAGVGLSMLSVGVRAQDASSLGDSQQTVQDHTGDMAARVKRALHSDPALNDKHIDVSMEKDKVVMKGFVNSQGDLQKAIRAANKAAGAKNVVNQLTINRSDDLNVTP